MLIAEETNLCYESNVVREVYLDTWLDTELVSVNIVLIVLVTYSTLKEEVNELRCAEVVTCVRSKLKFLLTCC